MLRNLEISNFVFVENLSLEFESGFNIFSGETGSGKSIIIDALAILLGKRATLLKIREGHDQAVISALFEITTKSEKFKINHWFKKHSFDENFSELLLRRVLDKAGKSRTWVNGQLCALSQMKELGDLLVEINGQHSHQKLMSQSYQRDTLDEFAQQNDDLDNLKVLWTQWQQSNNNLNSLKQAQEELNEKKDSLHWKIQELENLNLQVDEWDKLSLDQKKISQISELLGVFSTARTTLDSDTGIIRKLELITSELRNACEIDHSMKEVCELLEKGTIEIQEALIALRGCEKEAEVDEERAANVNQRFNDVMNTSHKVREQPDQLYAFYERI